MMIRYAHVYAALAATLWICGCSDGTYPLENPKLPQITAKATRLPSGTLIEDIKTGTGKEATTGTYLLIHYRGWLQDGTFLETSRGIKPFLVEKVGNAPVIVGWNEGLVGMKAGGIRVLVIPPEAAYGSEGVAGVIPPNNTLTFEIEALSVDQNRPSGTQ